MLKKWSQRKKLQETIYSPILGEIVSIEEVPDPTFSKKIVGEGVAIIPKEGKVVSPVNGKVIQLFPTKHAIGIRSEKGLEILIHIGLETVSMNGEGFAAHVEPGDEVKIGQLLIDFSPDLVRKKAKSVISPVVITNSERIENLKIKLFEESEQEKAPIMIITLKR